MLFNIEADFGDTLIGYVVPDNTAECPLLRLSAAGDVVWEGHANEDRAALVTAGRHRTGRCGFRIGAAEAPGLTAMADAELRAVDSDLVVYRRGGDRPRLARKLLRLETGLVPMTAFDARMERAFQAWHPAIERFGRETATQLFLLNGVPSVYLSGRLQLPTYGQLIDKGFGMIVALRDPFEELAERILIFSGAAGPLGQFLTDRDRMSFGAAIEALEDLDVASPRAVRTRMRRLDRQAAAELSNPLTRQLTTHRPDELCGAEAVSAALRTLACFDVVALRETEGQFEQATAECLGLDTVEPSPDPLAAPREVLAGELSEMRTVEAMLEFDLEVHDSVHAIIERTAI